MCRGRDDTEPLPCRLYADMAGAENAAKYQTPIFLVASASAEIIADVALCPWEAVKVRACAPCCMSARSLARGERVRREAGPSQPRV